MKNPLMIFTTKKKSADGRNYIIAFPKDKIYRIESIVGGQAVCLEINGIEVDGSFEQFKKDWGK